MITHYDIFLASSLNIFLCCLWKLQFYFTEFAFDGFYNEAAHRCEEACLLVGQLQTRRLCSGVEKNYALHPMVCLGGATVYLNGFQKD